MLTSDLLRFDIDDHTVSPRYLKRKYADHYLAIASDLIEIHRIHINRLRKVLDAVLNDYESDRVGYRIIRGLVKILESFSEFGPADQTDYPGLRAALFEFAEARRPIIRRPDLVHQTTSDLVLQDFGAAHGSLPDNLYNDLPENQILRRLDGRLTPEKLIRRYNLALAQGVLYRCHHMEIKVWDGYKTIFRYLKLARLMHKIRPEGDGYHIEIDGPFSLFRRTQKYGVSLARFLPGLLLAERWQMQAAINTPRGQRCFSLNQDCGLESYYRGADPFDSSIEERFYETFHKRKTEWQLQREPQILDLGDTVLIPDFMLAHPDGRQALMEVVGFWTPEYLEKKLLKLSRLGRKDLIVAVDEKLNCAKTDFDGPVIFYKTRLKVKDVLAVLEKVERSA